MENSFIKNSIALFEYYKALGEKTFSQIEDQQLFWQYNAESNSIAIIVQHLYGNMLSRWTDVFSSDGEKPWRNRDAEFQVVIQDKHTLLEKWEAGWQCLFQALHSIQECDMDKKIFIRNQAHSVTDAVQRQLAHYAYHVGQIVYIGKMASANWQSLSIAKNESETYNQTKFEKDKNDAHFTEDLK